MEVLMLKIIVSTLLLLISFVTLSAYVNNSGIRTKTINEETERVNKKDNNSSTSQS